MPRSFHSQPAVTLDQLRQPREFPREHAQILDLDAFRHLGRASSEHTTRETARTADTPITETQLRHELNLAFADLGGAAFALIHHGALNDERLAPRAQRIHQLHAQLGTLANSSAVDPA